MLKKITFTTFFLTISCAVFGMRKELGDKYPMFEQKVKTMKDNQEAEQSAKERRKKDPKEPKKIKIRRNSMEKFNKDYEFQPKYHKNFKKFDDDSSDEE